MNNQPEFEECEEFEELEETVHNPTGNDLISIHIFVVLAVRD